MKNSIILIALIMFSYSCGEDPSATASTTSNNSIDSPSAKKDTATGVIADAASILAKTEVPVLCYHDIRNTKPGVYSVPIETFKQQMKTLADSGYKTITPDEYYAYLTRGASLPEKPV